ncbi:hypothetical protein [Acinetobacter baumannii]|uniref:Uncharacterized protein n=2 Tax=Acinetobacter baumannii TaxID=470 RepID=A0A6A8BYE6_ACIBA|nr:hypothetical protein [Acinetobacter baumannii]CAH1091280.1 Uncharacterised protein [Acinetobacter phage MD-2021a]EKL8018207.1 hypothetical protein [Acinetobacter baumannii]EKU0802129.1 hypothetical protein [Acinetobacter baumannii]EKU1551290.1 hypothetical protein [Acinetobacter baumannii]EKU1714330.1 hypothetical protein [Acinetobacter baumannii]
MKNLMTNLETLGFTGRNGLNGLSLNDIEVSLHWSGEKAVVAVDGKQAFVSESEAEIIEFVKAELAKKELSKTNDQYDAEVMASEVAKDSEMKYYNDEDSHGKAELIKSAMSFLKFELPKTIKFTDFQRLVESNLNQGKNQ